MRRGLTLIEVLIALVLLEFGMLALIASSGVAVRDLAIANRRVRARWIADDRVAQLRMTACTGPQAGSARAPGGLTEFWQVAAIGSRRVIVDSVDIMLSSGRRDHLVARAWVLCPR